ncbi:hypothetical protein SNEBB_001405 [Seison nebaliae]|nr:hypothetical protein SNEBB_001405 [Seison nebaliae]
MVLGEAELNMAAHMRAQAQRMTDLLAQRNANLRAQGQTREQIMTGLERSNEHQIVQELRTMQLSTSTPLRNTTR